MKLVSLYSNQPEIFGPIRFNETLSAILAEIRIPENRQVDTHNLGKSTIADLLDFCLLRRKTSAFFLFKHFDRFHQFTFYLQIEVDVGRFLTIARAVDPGTRVNFKSTESPLEVATGQSVEWDHENVSFDRARLLLDGLLNVEVLKPWGVRKLVGYLIRGQADYQSVFQLSKFAGRHSEWKPFVAQVIGLDSAPVAEMYAKREAITRSAEHIESLRREWGPDQADVSVLDGLISVKRREISSKSEFLEKFDFQQADEHVSRELVTEIEDKIARLNERSYELNQLLRRLEESLAEQQVIFNLRDAEQLFAEAGVALGDQLVREFDQLVAFNKAITEERRSALAVQLEAARQELRSVTESLQPLNRQRSEALRFLTGSDSLSKFRELSIDLTGLRAELANLEGRREAARRMLELRREHRLLVEEEGNLRSVVEEDINRRSEDEDGRFGNLRRYFSEIVFDVLGQHAILAVKLNASGGLEFIAEFVEVSGMATSGDKGTTYKKLLCIAFDLAIVRSYLDTRFPRFVYHDGALEQLEPRKREKLIGVLREYSALGVQPVISLLDSDLPAPIGQGTDTLNSSDVVVVLHDEGIEGRLFKMEPW